MYSPKISFFLACNILVNYILANFRTTKTHDTCTNTIANGLHRYKNRTKLLQTFRTTNAYFKNTKPILIKIFSKMHAVYTDPLRCIRVLTDTKDKDKALLLRLCGQKIFERTSLGYLLHKKLFTSVPAKTMIRI